MTDTAIKILIFDGFKDRNKLQHFYKTRRIQEQGFTNTTTSGVHRVWADSDVFIEQGNRKRQAFPPYTLHSQAHEYNSTIKFLLSITLNLNTHPMWKD